LRGLSGIVQGAFYLRKSHLAVVVSDYSNWKNATVRQPSPAISRNETSRPAGKAAAVAQIIMERGTVDFSENA
jgi:hypothetical protein